MASESALTAEERNSLKITHFIFHIIIADEDDPIFLEEVQVDDAQKSFFIDRVIDASVGTQFIFSSREQNRLLDSCREILSSPQDNFLRVSKEIASDFLGHHSGRMSDGVFVVSRVTIERSGVLVPLLSLIKMDHQRVLQYNLEETPEGRRAIIEEITNSFVEDKFAMQKVALVEIGDQYAWDILARERGATEGVADYFRRFLGATERETASNLTKKAVKAVRQWASLVRHNLPEGHDPTAIKARAVNYMHTHDTFNTETFLDMLISDDDAERKRLNVQSLREHLETTGIAGQTFLTRPASLTNKIIRNKFSTEEGVKIEFDGAAEQSGVTIPAERDKSDGYFHIEIKTREIVSLA